MDPLTDIDLIDDIEVLRERLRVSELQAAEGNALRERLRLSELERDAMKVERDAMAAERDAAVLAACRVLMMADGYAILKEREMMRHLTCSAQHRMFAFV